MLSIPHMIVVFIIVLVVFGPNKLPELARGLGKLMAEFRKASTDFKSAFEQEMRDIERQTMLAERKKAAETAAAAAAAQPQPATLATPAGAETQGAGTSSGGVTDAAADSGAVAGDSDSRIDGRATEALLVTPVAEAVARGTNEDSDGVVGHSNMPHGNPAQENNGTGQLAETENTISDSHGVSAPQEASTDSVIANDPAHDTQQPA